MRQLVYSLDSIGSLSLSLNLLYVLVLRVRTAIVKLQSFVGIGLSLWVTFWLYEYDWMSRISSVLSFLSGCSLLEAYAWSVWTALVRHSLTLSLAVYVDLWTSAILNLLLDRFRISLDRRPYTLLDFIMQVDFLNNDHQVMLKVL